MIRSLIISLMAIASTNLYILKSKHEAKSILKNENCKVTSIKDNVTYYDCDSYKVKLFFDDNNMCIKTVKNENK
jgi:hypothetical protein